jgi:hypothetical protein
MKKLIAVAAMAALISTIGCDQSSTPGGPGATNSSAKKPMLGQTDDTFTLSAPSLSTSLKQGESHNLTIGIKRGTNFDADVTLKFEPMPKGVTIEPASPSIKHGDTDAKVTVKAADDAAVGDFTVKVMGHPSKGSEAASSRSP